MNSQIKQRVIGGIVIVAVLAIFLPILFHKAEKSQTVSLSTKIPTPPQQPQVVLSIPMLPSAGGSENASTVEHAQKAQPASPATPVSQVAVVQTPISPAPPNTSEQKNTLAVSTAPSASSTSAAIVTKTKTVSRRQGDQKVLAAKKRGPVIQASRATKETKPTRRAQATLPYASIPKAWVIQLGSFANKKNATLLVGKLRQSGFDAYIRSIDDQSHRTLTRVFVGPEINFDKATELRKLLKSKFELNGVIIKYKV